MTNSCFLMTIKMINQHKHLRKMNVLINVVIELGLNSRVFNYFTHCTSIISSTATSELNAEVRVTCPAVVV
jgi:hypothetical protein